MSFLVSLRRKEQTFVFPKGSRGRMGHFRQNRAAVGYGVQGARRSTCQRRQGARVKAPLTEDEQGSDGTGTADHETGAGSWGTRSARGQYPPASSGTWKQP